MIFFLRRFDSARIASDLKLARFGLEARSLREMEDIDWSVAAQGAGRHVCRSCRAALPLESKAASLCRACTEQLAGASGSSRDCSFESLASPMSQSAPGSREVSFKRRALPSFTSRECEDSPSKRPRSAMSVSAVSSAGSDVPPSLNSSLDSIPDFSRGAPPYPAPTGARRPDWTAKAPFHSRASPSSTRPSSATGGSCPLPRVSLRSIVDGPEPARASARADALHNSTFPFVRSGRAFNVHDWTI